MQTQEESQLGPALAEVLRTKQREQWLTENSEAVNAHNEDVEAPGVQRRRTELLMSISR
ncbi:MULTISPECIES: type II toxin-antitoxin system CcdA family antitoxin [unclassified Pseudomonas]|jgi:post-segregation antitoxin (ccd killing protein)|uniref:type II toxin-antitoxin system CcdA family antitoxin n=1 Tax=unclassified Pseudomonas TaxID=196821 RepID=UPI00210D59B4|nr:MULTISPECIES: type II toxin-antitoxin system CcdA family antitoxin [unclassified Pseudomonas]MDP9690638.1 post-segregation antitoxin (ccd killing protein) [Pseudomonas mohnii]